MVPAGLGVAADVGAAPGAGVLREAAPAELRHLLLVKRVELAERGVGLERDRGDPRDRRGAVDEGRADRRAAAGGDVALRGGSEVPLLQHSGQSIAWGLWETQSEMTGELSDAGRARLGALTLSSSEGLRLFDQACATAQPFVVAAPLDEGLLRGDVGTGLLTSLSNSRQLPAGLRFLSTTNVGELFIFPVDMQPVPAEPNRLNDQVLVRYYEQEWKDVAH